MNKLHNKLNILILTIILTIISTIIIFTIGDTYTATIDIGSDIKSIDELTIKNSNPEILEISNTKLENGKLIINYKSISRGISHVEVLKGNDNLISYRSIYCHKYGVITYDNYFGATNGGIIVPISITLILVYALSVFVRAYLINLKENMYQYKNITYLGLIIFLTFSIFNHIYSIFVYDDHGIAQTINDFIKLCNNFSFIVFPLAFITSILITISNIVLAKREGINLKNFLGMFFGTALCALTVAPSILSDYLQNATWVDVHNESGIARYIEDYIEVSIYILVSYLECIYIGTIAMGIKSAKHIPKFDKDAIIILGSQIKKDGTLTNLLKSRVDRAIEFSKLQKENSNKDIVFVPSGGQGRDEVMSEALAMKNYLLSQKITSDRILVEDKSTNTDENIKFSNALINNKLGKSNVTFSTTNYHVFRAGYIAYNQKLNYEGIGARTKSYFWINAFIREFLATLFLEKKKHLFVMIFILFSAACFIALSYFSNNL